MTKKIFTAMQVEEIDSKQFKRSIVSKSVEELPEGDVLIRVKYSSLNYKDALSASGNKGVTRSYPHTPGIDAVGVVEESKSGKYKEGDEVIVTSYDLGMNTSGGFGQYVRVPEEWVVSLPETLSSRDAMIIGTAGFTAALSVYKMISGGVKPEDGEVLVTGATGGVGTVAVQILAKLGYKVVAATGKLTEKKMLEEMGAVELIDRNELNDESGKPVLRSRWAGVIDTVGGNMLATAIKTAKYDGVVTCCGNVAGHTFNSSVYPFILRGVSLMGVDSANTPMSMRLKVWELLATDWKLNFNEEYVSEVNLEQLNDKIDLILKGQLKGRTIVNLNS